MNFEYAGYPEMYTYENFTRDLKNLEPYKKFIRTLIEKYECYSKDKIIKDTKKILKFNIVDYYEEDMYYDAKVSMNDKDRYIYFVCDNKLLYKFDRYYGVLFKHCLANPPQHYFSSIYIIDIMQNKYNIDEFSLSNFLLNEIIFNSNKNIEEIKDACLINDSIYLELNEEYKDNIDIAKTSIYSNYLNYYYAGDNVKKNKDIRLYCINRINNIEGDLNDD